MEAPESPPHRGAAGFVERVIRISAARPWSAVALGVGAAIWGAWCLSKTRIDVIPDLSDPQVILYSEWMGRSPDQVENQITYPLVTAMQASSGVKDVRGLSMFGMSFVNVLFEDGTDLYWARARALESLSKLGDRLPPGVTPRIGPDATAVGWIFQYALVDPQGKQDPGAIRAFQDWELRYWLASVPGVAEVATVGGFAKQFVVEVDPTRMAALRIGIDRVASALRRSNQDAGGSTIEANERELYLRARGYLESASQIEGISLGLGPGSVPIRIADIGRVIQGPVIRRGISDLDGMGDVVGGVVVMRQGGDAAEVIEAVRRKLEEVKPAFPDGIELRTVYDRAPLIRESARTLGESLVEELALVSLVILLFLFHARSAVIVAISMGISVLASLVPAYYLGVGLNIMSMGGIILAVGDLVDGVLLFVENAHRKLSVAGIPPENRASVITRACAELGPAIFGSLLVIAVSFLPIFALQAEEGRLFHPLAYTKTFAMLAGAFVTLTVAPALIRLLMQKGGKLRSAGENPIEKALQKAYGPSLAFTLRHPRGTLAGAVLLALASGVGFTRLGSEFMPSLWEGDLLYMPVTIPGISVAAASDLLKRQDQAIRAVPEVESVFGKAGRFDSPTDPAPLSMIEMNVRLKPRASWRAGMTEEKLVEELDRAVAVPGLQRAWTRPVRGRVDMLSTGIRTPVGIKILGRDLEAIEETGRRIERALSKVRGTRSVYADRVNTGSYLDFEIDREILARYGLQVGDAQDAIETAIGGMTITETIDGRARFPISLRYPRELRDDPAMLARVLVPTPTGAQVPLGQLGRLVTRSGPTMILDENGSLAGYVYVDLEGRDPGGYVEEAKAAVAREVRLPPGTFLRWTGQYEHLARMQARMKLILPLTAVLIFAFLVVSLGGASRALLVMAAVPLSLAGSVFFLLAAGYHTSVAVWAGAIALIGVAVETASLLIVYLDQAWAGLAPGADEAARLAATTEGARRSLRPVLMAVSMNLFGLIPVMAATGLGADVMKRISSPMFGGLVTLALLVVLILPVAYHELRRRVAG